MYVLVVVGGDRGMTIARTTYLMMDDVNGVYKIVYFHLFILAKKLRGVYRVSCLEIVHWWSPLFRTTLIGGLIYINIIV
jgi:hypothetical protein